MAILLCQLLLLFSETLLSAERPLRHSRDTSYPAHDLHAGSWHPKCIGGGWASSLYKHRLLVNLGALIREKFVLASFFSHCLVSFSPSLPFRSTRLAWPQAVTIPWGIHKNTNHLNLFTPNLHPNVLPPLPFLSPLWQILPHSPSPSPLTEAREGSPVRGMESTSRLNIQGKFPLYLLGPT